MKAAEGRRVSRILDTISENGSIVLLSRVLAKTSPDGKGKVEYILFLSKEEEKLIPQGITTHQTWVSSAYGDDEACKHAIYQHECLLISFLQSLHVSTVRFPNGLKLPPKIQNHSSQTACESYLTD